MEASFDFPAALAELVAIAVEHDSTGSRQRSDDGQGIPEMERFEDDAAGATVTVWLDRAAE